VAQEIAGAAAAASLGIKRLFEEISDKRRAVLMKDAGPYSKNQPTASDISECTRETALAILHWRERPGFDEKILARLEIGREFEASIMSKLFALGIPIVDVQSIVELKGRSGKVVLRGKCDGKVEINRKRYPFDIKSCHPNFFQSLNSLEDFQRNKFARKWLRQIQVYEFLSDVEMGFILLVSLTGEWKFILVQLDYEEMEGLFKQAEEAVEAVEGVRAGLSEDLCLPPFHKDSSVCLKCWAYKNVCYPPVEFEGGLSVLDDPATEVKLDRLAEVKPFKKEAEQLEKELKARFEGAELVVVGDWIVRGEEKVRNNKAQRAKKAKQTKYWQTKFERVSETQAEEGDD